MRRWNEVSQNTYNAPNIHGFGSTVDSLNGKTVWRYVVTDTDGNTIETGYEDTLDLAKESAGYAMVRCTREASVSAMKRNGFSC